MEIIKYNDYEGSCEISMEDGVCHGKILFIDDLVTYEADTPTNLKKEFESAVDDYLHTCEQLGIKPKKPLKGQFNVRISPELHKKAAIKAAEENISMNEVVKNALECYLYPKHDFNHNICITVNDLNAEIGENFNIPKGIEWMNLPFAMNGSKSNAKH